MAMTNNDRLRRMVGDRIQPGSDGESFFSNDEIADLLAQAGGNLPRAAMQGWLDKMAEFAKLIDTDISGANRKFSQMYKQAESMARHYGSVVGADMDAMIGRVVGRPINLREHSRARVMPASTGFRSEAANPEAKRVMQNSHPELIDDDPLYPESRPVPT